MECRLQLARTAADDAGEKERLYLRIIDECADTEWAEEACWDLANLYLDGFDEAKEDKAREILEHSMQRYPDSAWTPHVEQKLLWLYEGTDGRERQLQLYEAVLKRDMPISVRLSSMLRCAAAYEAAGNKEKARGWYNRVVEDGSAAGAGNEVEQARRRLAALNKK